MPILALISPCNMTSPWFLKKLASSKNISRILCLSSDSPLFGLCLLDLFGGLA